MSKKAGTSEHKTGVAAWNEEVGNVSRHSNVASEKRGQVVALVLLAVLCVASVLCFLPLKERITRGLWLKEGAATTFTAKKDDGSKPSADELQSTAKAIGDRLAASGVSEYDVRVEGDDTVVVDLAWNTDAEPLARLVGGKGKVEFAKLDEIGDADAVMKINAGTSNVELKDGSYKSFLDGSAIESAEVIDYGYGYYPISVTLNEEGKKTLGEVTEELAKDSGRMALIVDGVVLTAPSVSEKIEDGVVSISGGFNGEQAKAFEALIEKGELPLSLEYSATSQSGPVVGKQMLWGLLLGSCVALVALLVVGFVRFGKLAVLPFGAMAVFAVLMLGFMAIGSMNNMFVLTMPGVAGGMVAAALTAACVLLMVFDFHKKISAGRNVRGASMTAPKDGMQRMLMPCVVLAVASGVVMFVPVAPIREFGTTMVLGAVAGVIAVFWYARTLLSLLAETSIKKNPAGWGVGSKATSDPVAAEAS